MHGGEVVTLNGNNNLKNHGGKKVKRKIRTPYNLQGFNDDEKGDRKVITEQSGYVPLSELVSKMTTGNADIRYEPEYSVDEKMSDEEAFETEDITQTDGFDLTDTASIRAKEEEAKKFLKFVEEKRLAEKKRKDEKSRFGTAANPDVGNSSRGLQDSDVTEVSTKAKEKKKEADRAKAVENES